MTDNPNNDQNVGTFEYMRERDDGDFDIVFSDNGVETVVRILPVADREYPNGRPSTEDATREARQMRDGLLSSTDFTQVPDWANAKKAEWATYRQALRALPTHANWPTLVQSDWPTPPESGVVPQ